MIKLDIFIKKVETEGIIDIDTIKQGIEEYKFGMYTDEDKVYPYHELSTNKVEKENVITSQMEQWSILSNVVIY